MIRPRIVALAWALALAAPMAAGPAVAQQLYRWTDETGRVHITDTPPPASAKDVQRKSAPGTPVVAEPQPSFELSQAQKDFPVVLYTSPECKAPCDNARAALNRRGVPFTEIAIHDKATLEELKRVTNGSDQVPVLLVGRSVQKGYSQESFDALLDAARYPRAGVLPPRSQAAPKPAADTPQAAEEPAPTGPYAPRYSR